MAGGSTERIFGPGAVVPAPIQLVSWPLRDDGFAAWGLLALLVASAVGAGSAVHSVAMGSLIFAGLAAAAWRLWIPVRFELGSKGITQSVVGRQRRIPWSAVARYEPRRHGLLFLMDQEPDSLSVLRGLYVRCRQNRAEVIELAEFFLQARASGPGSTPRLRSS